MALKLWSQILPNQRVYIRCTYIAVSGGSYLWYGWRQHPGCLDARSTIQYFLVVSYIPGADILIADLFSTWQGTASFLINYMNIQVHIDYMILNYEI